MRRILALIAVCVACCRMAPAQELRPVEATFDDYLPMLNNAGYEAFPFDISSMSDRMYQITFKIREYDHGALVCDDWGGWPKTMKNMTPVSVFSPESQASITSDEMDDPERGIYRLAKKMMIGVLPVRNDTVRPVMIDVEKMGSMCLSLNMKPQYAGNDSIDGKPMYSYMTRPFKVDSLRMESFTPLVLLGSMWYDERFKIHRFCGENEIDPGMSAEILKYIPHYYVIGVEVKPMEETPKQ